MRITLDTNFLISATQWNKSVAHKALIKFIKKDYKLFSTESILTEFSEVLARDFKYDNKGIEKILSNLIGIIRVVEPKTKLKIVKDDPDDDKILECAVDSNSEYIITYDRHLLNIKQYREIKIITPEEAIRLI